ncbi:MAG TPA: CcdB family protein [Gammaproteobacteria bacterium]|nr:CcdB family protein [Gammaproteobacteria bacterium]
MRQFDVLTNIDARSAQWAPYVVVLQHDLLGDLDTVVAAPLVREDQAPRPLHGLDPVVELSGERFVVSTQELAGVSRRHLGEVAGTLEAKRDALIKAIDLLFTGI